MPATGDVFAFEDVTVTFGDRIVLDRVSLTVPDGGAVTCILGPSGSGKSTLLRLCNRLEVPTTGTVRFRGADLDDLDPLRLRRQVGMVFQRPTPFPGSVRDNLHVAAPDADDAKLRSVLERVDLPVRFLDHEADTLSGGEAQRACLARTLLTSPDVVLMDEPSSALDPAATHALEHLGLALAADGIPVLWVTHALDQAERIADRSIVLVEGRVAAPDEAARFLSGEIDHGQR